MAVDINKLVADNGQTKILEDGEYIINSRYPDVDYLI
jgi:hypothetical protein